MTKENAPATNHESAPSKRNYNPGQLPKRKNTVTAAVLAGLLEGETLTGMDAVFGQHTTRLGAVVFWLDKRYGWTIERRDIATGTKDGRVATISAYWLPQATRAAAYEANARNWVDAVKVARAKLRKTADKRRAEAAKINAARRYARTQDPRQSGLWGEV
ncbi:helix-turn-helix domain-containing protein [Eoetvoesiella caeni]